MTSGLSISSLPPVAAERAEPEPRAAQVVATAPQATAAGTPNPTLRLDPALGLVVLQFHEGDQTESIPTVQQLDAYRIGSAHPPGADKPLPSPPASEPGAAAHRLAPAAT